MAPSSRSLLVSRPDLPLPDGWFAVGLSRELARGAVTTHTFFGRDVVVFRTEGGAAAAMDAICPHLGAHMGRGGRVSGEHLRCPFHGFEFDATGVCARTPYGGSPPRRARAGALPVVERAGFVLVWSGDGEPGWQVPELDARGWTPPALRAFELRGHPQETTENSVDVGHFGVVHGFRDVAVEAPLEVDGPLLTAAYSMTHSGAPIGLPRLGFRSRFSIEAWGLGYSLVRVEAPAVGFRSRAWVLSTPAAEGRISMRLAISVPELPLGPAGRLASRAVRRAALALFVHDTAQDFPIWAAKEHLRAPALAKGDGPIGRYREWASQFYPRREVAA